MVISKVAVPNHYVQFLLRSIASIAHLAFENDTKRLQRVSNKFTAVVLHLHWEIKCCLLYHFYNYSVHIFRDCFSIKFSTTYE
jgi:hypothetical protein